MQVSLNIKDSYYAQFLELLKKIPSNAIDIVSSDNRLDEETISYMQTEQYKKDKAHYQKILEGINTGEVEVVPFEDGLDELDDFIDNIK